MPRYDHIVVLTGSGISAESGVATFRDKDGIWARHKIEDVATPQAFARDSARVHDFYNTRRRGLDGIKPNSAHLALARLEREHTAHPGRQFMLVTQNVDALHESGGSRAVVHMHGEMLRAFCVHCTVRRDWTGDITTQIACSACGKTGGMRPDIVWFGEMPYHMDRIEAALTNADLFISIGTSGTVYPAAGFVATARTAGAHTAELNLEPSQGASLFAEAIHGKASEIVPTYVNRLLAASS